VKRRIVAMGGGGFSMGPDHTRLDDHVLGLTGKPEPRVCFVPTASGDADNYLMRFYQAFAIRRCRASHLNLFRRTVADLRGLVLAQDVIYVGGGNTANLLAVWRTHGLDVVLREAWEAGVILCGVSAGAACWFEAAVVDSFGPPLAPLRNGLGLLAGSHCPHYAFEPERRPAFQRLIGEGGLPAGLAADDDCALCFEGTELVDVVAERAGAQAYRVAAAAGGGVTEEALPARLLG
jgi:dipeptidase E